MTCPPTAEYEFRKTAFIQSVIIEEKIKLFFFKRHILRVDDALWEAQPVAVHQSHIHFYHL